MKTPSLTISNGKILLKTKDREYVITREGLARLRYQSGDLLLRLTRTDENQTARDTVEGE